LAGGALSLYGIYSMWLSTADWRETYYEAGGLKILSIAIGIGALLVGLLAILASIPLMKRGDRRFVKPSY